MTTMQETPGPDEDLPDPEERTGALVVLLPAADDPITAATSEDMAHMTTIWFGDVNEMSTDREDLVQAVRLYAQDLDGPLVVPVKERGLLGDDDADVVFLELTDSLEALRDGMLANEPIRAAYDAAEQFPQWVPHVTLGYPEGVENGPAVAEYDDTEVTFDRLGLWLGGDYTEYPMGGTVDTITADAAAVIGDVDEEIPVDELDDDEELITEIPVHGVLAPEGIPTGDGRGFREGALSTRPLPVPLRMEIVGSHGGNNTSEVVTVGRVDEAWRDDASGMWRFRGAIVLSKPYASQAIESIADGTGTGVSIDADAMEQDLSEFFDADGNMIEQEFDPETAGQVQMTWFKSARVAGLTMVPIPAFHEAYIALGPDFTEDKTEEQLAAAATILADCGCGDDDIVDLSGDPEANERARQEAVGLEPGTFAPGTKDGPGWITHPVPTSRIRRYWVRGEGAAKIRWGVPGDFDRCRRQLVKYVQNPDWLAGLCANMHKEALGVWPGQESGGRHALIAAGGVPAPMMTLVADASERQVYPAEWFADPKFDQPTNLTIDRESGRIFGHLAYWNSCHLGIAGTCVKPPHSASGYAGFLKGLVDTTGGDQAVGCLTYGIGHANPSLRAAAATAHYDRPDAVVAYVNVGEDSHGIWYAGVLRPGLSDQRIDEFRAIGAISGDWRHIGRYGLELIAAVGVNTPGLPVSLAASGGVQESLIMSFEQHPETITASAETDENQRYLARAAAMAVEIIENKKRATEARKRAHSLRQSDLRARANGKG